MANIAQNITEISKIIGCSEQFYKKQSNQTDPYYESTMYLVNNGEYINSQQGYISNADFPHVDLPNFSSLLRNNVNYIQFIAYSNADKKFHLFSCNSAASQYCSVTASGTVLNVYTNLYHCQCYHYSYTPGDENWVEISHWAYNNTLNYSKNEPFKVVWCSSNFVINFTDLGDVYTFCPDLLEADPVEGKYFACFYDIDGTYLNNDIYIKEDLAYTDLYYGARKLSDTVICQNYPDDPSYPNDKIYLQPTYESKHSDSYRQVSPAYVTEVSVGDGTNKTFDLNHTYANNNTLVVTATINGTTVTNVPYEYDSEDNSVTLTSENAPDDGTDVSITYYQTDSTYEVRLSKHPSEIKNVFINSVQISSYTYDETTNKVIITLPSDIIDKQLSTKVVYLMSNLVTGYKVYFKHANFVIPLATTDQLILVEEVEDNPAVLKMTMTINGQTVQANILCVNEDGSLPNNLYDQLYQQLELALADKLSKTLVWEYLGDSTEYSDLFVPNASTEYPDYNDFVNKPRVNDEILEDNKTTEDLHLEIGAQNL